MAELEDPLPNESEEFGLIRWAVEKAAHLDLHEAPHHFEFVYEYQYPEEGEVLYTPATTSLDELHRFRQKLRSMDVTYALHVRMVHGPILLHGDTFWKFTRRRPHWRFER